MSNTDKLLYIDGLGEITQNLNIGGNINLTETLFTKKIGIGTSSPEVGLHVKGNGHTANRIEIKSTDSNDPVLQFKRLNTMAHFFFDGQNLKYSHSLVQHSDDRIKENESLISNSINTILKLRPQTYIKKRNNVYK